MRLLALTTLATLGWVGIATAQTLPAHAIRNGAAQAPEPGYFIAGDKVAVEHFAEWEVDNKSAKSVQIAEGKAADKAPATAVRYEQKNYVFPTGAIRVLTFKKAHGGILHAITTENALFMLSGTAAVDVAGKNVVLRAGDAVNYPSGVLRGTGDATVLVWKVTGTVGPDVSAAKVVRASEAKITDSAEWDVDGKRVRANTKTELAKAPKNAIRLSVSRYQFDGNSIRVARNKKGGPTSVTSAAQDALIYVTAGKLRYFHNDESVEAGPGDAIREIAGAKSHWYRIEDSSFVAISSLPIEGAKPSPETNH